MPVARGQTQCDTFMHVLRRLVGGATSSIRQGNQAPHNGKESNSQRYGRIISLRAVTRKATLSIMAGHPTSAQWRKNGTLGDRAVAGKAIMAGKPTSAQWQGKQAPRVMAGTSNAVQWRRATSKHYGRETNHRAGAAKHASELMARASTSARWQEKAALPSAYHGKDAEPCAVAGKHAAYKCRQRHSAI